MVDGASLCVLLRILMRLCCDFDSDPPLFRDGRSSARAYACTFSRLSRLASVAAGPTRRTLRTGNHFMGPTTELWSDTGSVLSPPTRSEPSLELLTISSFSRIYDIQINPIISLLRAGKGTSHAREKEITMPDVSRDVKVCVCVTFLY